MFSRKMGSIIIVPVLVLLFFTIRLNAAEEIAPGKKSIIRELLELTGAKRGLENSVNAGLAGMNESYIQFMSQKLEEEGVSIASNQEELKKKLSESQLPFSYRLMELSTQRINLDQIMEQVHYPIYDKYFTEDELKDLLAFHKSPTGKKSIEVAPALSQELMQSTMVALQPEAVKFYNEMLEEEKERLLKTE